MSSLASILYSNALYWFVITIAVLAFFYWHGFGKYQAFRKLGIPGPRPLPFIAHLVDFVKNDFNLLKFMTSYVKQYGSCVGFFLSGNPTLLVSDLDMLKQILVKDFSKFQDRAGFIDLPEPMASFMTVVKGDRWTFLRTTLSPAFTSGKLRPMCGMMSGITDTLIGKCRVSAERKGPVDVVKLLQGLTMEVILSSAFGVSVNTQTNPNDPITEKAKLALQQPKWMNLVSPLPYSNKFIKYLPYGFKYQMEPIGNVAKEIIKQRRQTGFKPNPKDLLQLMLDVQDEPDKHGRRLTDHDVVAQAIIFLLAGYETTSSSLILNIYHLAKNQDIQNKLYEEIVNTWPSDKMPDYDYVQSLQYLDMVVSETLRLYPPGYMVMRECTDDCVVKNIPFKRGFKIIIPVYTIHRDPNIWDNPDKFDPERFRPEAKAKMNPYAYLPFGHGPHNCIGQRFALMEIKLVLARVLKEFKFDVCSDTPTTPKFTVFAAMTVNSPLNLTISRRGP